MKLYARCRSCKTDFKLEKSYLTRPDLIADLGEYFNLNCSDCGNTKEYHANDIEAKEAFSGSLIGTVIGIAILVIATLFAWFQGYISTIGFALGGVIIAASNMSKLTSNTKAFNSYKISRNPNR